MGSPSPISSLRWSGYLIGFSFAGFFDGILLHQILQWHHLLSSVESNIFQNLRTQILADGLFHAAMYIIAILGLALLWHSKYILLFKSSGTFPSFSLLSPLLIGFGLWHIVDGILIHWILGLHRIRPNSDHILLWDLLFFGLGIICFVIGYLLKNSNRKPTSTPALFLSIGILIVAFISALPWQKEGVVTVVFNPKVTIKEVLAAADEVRGRLMWANRTGDIWMFSVPNTRKAWHLYEREGVWFVGGSFFGINCSTSFFSSPSPLP